MSNQITGRAFITVNGQRLRSKEGAKLNIGGVERSTITGDSGVHGFAEKIMAPTLECSVSHAGDTSLTEMAGWKDVSIAFETDTGKVYQLRNAWLETPPELTAGEGEVALKFAAMSCEEA